MLFFGKEYSLLAVAMKITSKTVLHSNISFYGINDNKEILCAYHEQSTGSEILLINSTLVYYCSKKINIKYINIQSADDVKIKICSIYIIIEKSIHNSKFQIKNLPFLFNKKCQSLMNFKIIVKNFLFFRSNGCKKPFEKV